MRQALANRKKQAVGSVISSERLRSSDNETELLIILPPLNVFTEKGRIGADAPKQYRKTVQHRERTPRVKLHIYVVNKLGK